MLWPARPGRGLGSSPRRGSPGRPPPPPPPTPAAAPGLRDAGGLLVSGASTGEAGAGELIDPDTVALRAPLPRPGKIVCVGLNYHDHCREQGIEPPAAPPPLATRA